jgi:predicted aspartyl protease
MPRELSNSYNERDFDPPAPTVDILLTTPDPELLKQSNPIKKMALLDSGADMTAIPSSLVNELKLKKIDDIIVTNYQGGLSRTSIFVIRVIITGLLDLNIRVITSNLDYVHIGRDIMNKWKLYLNGLNKELKIEN